MPSTRRPRRRAAPAPVAAPAPAPARSYLVFFDWDKADLTDRAKAIVKEAADNSTRVQVTRIEVNGYTDTSGTPQYNQGLSVRRAKAVAGELVRDGVPQNVIAIQGFGETHLLVPRAPACGSRRTGGWRSSSAKCPQAGGIGAASHSPSWPGVVPAIRASTVVRRWPGRPAMTVRQRRLLALPLCDSRKVVLASLCRKAKRSTLPSNLTITLDAPGQRTDKHAVLRTVRRTPGVTMRLMRRHDPRHGAVCCARSDFSVFFGWAR